MKAWIYKWLPICFGCHCRPDRSFFYKGQQLPLCARCTGEFFGILLGMVLIFFFRPPAWIPGLLAVPLVLDGTVQYFTAYESNNLKRVITGFLFGYALFTLAALICMAGFRHGRHLASQWKH